MRRAISRLFRTRGFTLTESAIVLAVIGLVISGVWSIAGNVREGTKVLDAVNEGQSVKQAFLDFRGGHPYPAAAAGSKVEALIAADVIPDEYRNPADTQSLKTPWGKSTLVLWALQAPASNRLLFRLSYYGVPSMKACMNLLMQMTACQAGQHGCPTAVYTKKILVSGQPTALPTGWAMLVQPHLTYSSYAEYMCAQQGYSGVALAANSVEFDYDY